MNRRWSASLTSPTLIISRYFSATSGRKLNPTISNVIENRNKFLWWIWYGRTKIVEKEYNCILNGQGIGNFFQFPSQKRSTDWNLYFWTEYLWYLLHLLQIPIFFKCQHFAYGILCIIIRVRFIFYSFFGGSKLQLQEVYINLNRKTSKCSDSRGDENI